VNPEQQPARPIRKRAPLQNNTSDERGSIEDGNGAAVVRALNEAGQSMTRSLYQISVSLGERQLESAQRYLTALQSALDQGAVNELNAAYGAYMNALAAQDPARLSEAQAAYVDLVLKLSAAANEHADSATRSCVADLRQALTEAHSAGRKQYSQYLDTLRSIFSGVDDADLRPETLSMVAQNIAAAAAVGTAVFRHGE
jgi:uncharacterized protein YecT (DUF1311 family)